MSSFEASGAALLAHRSLLGERRERVGARHRGQAVEPVVLVVEGLVEHHQGARHGSSRLPVPVVRRALVDATPQVSVAVVPEVDPPGEGPRGAPGGRPQVPGQDLRELLVDGRRRGPERDRARRSTRRRWHAWRRRRTPAAEVDPTRR